MDFYEFDKDITWDDINKFNFPNQKIGVIIHIENNNNDILLQQRGKKSQDENGLYEDIGGRVESSDIDFKTAILREINEEAGSDMKLEDIHSLGIFHCFKNNINWIFIIYFGRYIKGEIKIMEPDKCLGYKFFKYEDVIKSDLVSLSCRYLIKQIRGIYERDRT